MSLSEAKTDLTQAQNWTPKTLAKAVINTLSKEKAREVSAALTGETAELNDFLRAEGKVKRIDFTSLIHYICTTGLKKRSETELVSILGGLYIRLALESEQKEQKKLTLLSKEGDVSWEVQKIKTSTLRRVHHIHWEYHKATTRLQKTLHAA